MIRPILIAAVALFPAWGAALAQDSDDLRVRVGLGAQVQPKFIGADESELAPLFELDFARGSNAFDFEAPDYRFGLDVISSGGFSAGPSASFASSRKESDVGAPVGKVKSTVELGAFASYAVSDTIHLRAEIVKGLGGHKGIVGQLGADAVWRDGDRYVFSVGPRLLFSNARYHRAYFEVTPAAALATGLPEYRPSGGIHGVALASGLSTQFTPRIGMFGYARYERLVGDAADSPIVRELGSRNQLSGGIGLNYTFTIDR
ncbi:MipA/OmpV family protein [Sphingomonas lutea]|uniref:MipA/OmpV family protein n=1 Tax=Sphingomonas lutea TaxID=1045317 RepID=A0A7G9SIB5_9SPHN|nr:MipA/OmpV family protein [Sphingomonas lutea]QNN67590.1 MipA/OmpV family protein [Sphingomonas lutea]